MLFSTSFSPGTLRHPSPNDFPSVGCAVGRFGRRSDGLPGYVSLPSVLHDGDGGEVPGQGPGLLGPRHAPFYVTGDLNRPDFTIQTLVLPEELNGERFRARVRLGHYRPGHEFHHPGTATERDIRHRAVI